MITPTDTTETRVDDPPFDGGWSVPVESDSPLAKAVAEPVEDFVWGAVTTEEFKEEKKSVNHQNRNFCGQNSSLCEGPAATCMRILRHGKLKLGLRQCVCCVTQRSTSLPSAMVSPG